MGECYYHGLSNPGCPECEAERRKKAIENNEPYIYADTWTKEDIFPDLKLDGFSTPRKAE